MAFERRVRGGKEGGSLGCKERSLGFLNPKAQLFSGEGRRLKNKRRLSISSFI